MGLRELEPLPDEASKVCSGWFRGPRGRKVFLLTCKQCGQESRWFRSTSPEVILNPCRWGRLCGEQEDLRAWLASILGVELRAGIPLDWDHVWSECRVGGADEESSRWQVLDGNARNFAARLDEGIGAWTFVLTLGSNPKLCGDASEEYLRCQAEGGRADDRLVGEMQRWREVVHQSRLDSSGQTTQTRTLNGHVLHRAGFTAEHITRILQHAVSDHGHSEWWQMQGT